MSGEVRTVTALSVLMAALVPPPPAHAGCDLDVARLEPSRGSVAAGARCGSIVIATDAGATRSSKAQIRARATIPYTLRLGARRLTGDGDGHVELELQGVYFMWRDGAWGVYFDEAQFARDGWHLVGALDSRREHRVVIVRTVGEVAITFDGVALGRWQLAETTGAGPSIGLTGRRGARARLLVRDVSLTPLRAVAAR